LSRDAKLDHKGIVSKLDFSFGERLNVENTERYLSSGLIVTIKQEQNAKSNQ